jgi:hypothetical protein
MRFTYNEREMYRNDPDYAILETEVPGIEIFYNEENKIVAVFTGKKKKSSSKYRFKTIERFHEYMDEEVKNHFDNLARKEMKKEEDKKLAKMNREKVNVGDIFHTSWGYEQTNVNFFQIIEKKSASTVLIREISSEVLEETSWCSNTINPIKDAFIGDTKKCTINKYGQIVKADRYGNNAYNTNGKRGFHQSWGY